MESPGIGARLGRKVGDAATRATERSRTTRDNHYWIDRIVTAAERYYHRSVGRQATVVTYAAYFLAFPLLVIYLMLIAMVFQASPRANEFVVRMLELPGDTNLGDIVNTTFDTSLDAFFGLIGAIGVVLAAGATASNFRSANEMIFGITSPRRSILRAPALDFSAGIWLALVILASWVLALGSLTRRGIVNDVIGAQVPWLAVFAVRASSVAISLALLAFVFDRSIRRLHTQVTGRNRVLGSLAAAVVLVVVSNYGFLIFLVWTLADPDGGGGFALAIALLMWVSIVVRAVMFVLCWIAVDIPDADDDDAEMADTNHRAGEGAVASADLEPIAPPPHTP